MSPAEPLAGVVGFVFPNEANVSWTVMIVLYPYVTGLVAGAFIVSSLYHLFGREALRPVARFALVSSLAFLLFAPLPLLLHLGKPLRALNIMITPSSTSAMAGFGVVYLAYLAIVVVEVWFALREDIVRLARASRGVGGFVFKLIALGDLTVDDHTRSTDRKVIRFLAAIGIPVACFLHGYVGFLFGSIKANPWWSTPLLFVIFLLSAIVSGIAVLIFLFYIISWLRKVTIDQECMRLLANYLWGFMIVDVALEVMEVLSIAYEQTENWEALRILIRDKLFVSYVVVQLLVCSLLPFVMLGLNAVGRLKARVANLLVFASAVLLLVQVLAMRWNVVVGGQLMSKSFRGYTSYVPGILDKEGLFVALVIFTVPFLLLRFVDRIVPLFPPDTPIGGVGAQP